MIQPQGEANQLTVELIIDWKGINPDGLVAIGKLRQAIRIAITDDGKLEIVEIREQQLLPDLEPWTKLLC